MQSNLVSSAISWCLPLLNKFSNRQLQSFVPPIPVKFGNKKKSLRKIAQEDTIVLNVLKHIYQNTPSDKLKQRLTTYLAHPVLGSKKARKKLYKKHGLTGLSSITITPTVVCNLRCEQCYNLYEYHHLRNNSLSLEMMHKVVSEGKELGAYRVTIIGGEPLVCEKDLYELAQRHKEVLFTIFSNGILMTDEIAHKFATLGNVEFCISIDGLPKTHENWRGAGTFDKAVDAVERYHKAGGMVMFAPTASAANYKEILSDEFLDLLISKGAYMAYLHHYDLVGAQNQIKWLLTKEQLDWMEKRILEVVHTKTLAIFSNVLNKTFQGGCKAVKEFIHVNHKGEVEPCCMVPFAADNVYEKPLIEIMKSKFFGRLNNTAADEKDIKRCLVGGNCGVLKQSVEKKEAIGTTIHSEKIFAHQDMEDQELLPTCFCRE